MYKPTKILGKCRLCMKIILGGEAFETITQDFASKFEAVTCQKLKPDDLQSGMMCVFCSKDFSLVWQSREFFIHNQMIQQKLENEGASTSKQSNGIIKETQPLQLEQSSTEEEIELPQPKIFQDNSPKKEPAELNEMNFSDPACEPAEVPPSITRFVLPPSKKVRQNAPNSLRFACGICESKFHSNWYLKEHLKRLHVEVKQIICDHCEFRAAMKKDLIRHFHRHHVPEVFKPRYTCLNCGIIKRSKPQIVYHIKTAHKNDEEKIRCEYCEDSKTFTGLSGLRRHIRSAHIKELNFGCPSCNKRFLQWYSLKDHYTRYHQTKTPAPVKLKMIKPMNDCKVCSKKFFSKKSLEMHVKEHEEKSEMRLKQGSKLRRESLKKREHAMDHNEATVDDSSEMMEI